MKQQTATALDLIVIDDHSTDQSVETTHQWLIQSADRFRKALLLQHEQNKGPAAARNTAISQSSTPFLFILDADNSIYPSCLEKLQRGLQNCNAAFAFCYFRKFGVRNGIKNSGPWLPASLTRINHVDGMVLLRKSVWERVGGYTENRFTRMGWEDYDFWFKLVRIDEWGVAIPEILAQYRSHKMSRSYHTQNPNAHRLLWYLYRNYPEFWHNKEPREQLQDFLYMIRVFASRIIGRILGWRWLY